MLPGDTVITAADAVGQGRSFGRGNPIFGQAKFGHSAGNSWRVVPAVPANRQSMQIPLPHRHPPKFFALLNGPSPRCVGVSRYVPYRKAVKIPIRQCFWRSRVARQLPHIPLINCPLSRAFFSNWLPLTGWHCRC